MTTFARASEAMDFPVTKLLQHFQELCFVAELLMVGIIAVVGADELAPSPENVRAALLV
jgi:hypothetical protein